MNRDNNKGWKDFTPEELVRVAKMIDGAGYGDITLNMNDTFAYASAWGTDCDEYDILPVSKLFEKYGIDGVVAWSALKDKVEGNPIGFGRYPNFNKAKKEILADWNKYFWYEKKDGEQK